MDDNKDGKRFSDWEEVTCNDCDNYWTGSCDGVQGSTRLCTAYKATRGVNIPLQVKSLQNSVKWLCRWCLILSGLVLGLLGVVFTYLII